MAQHQGWQGRVGLAVCLATGLATSFMSDAIAQIVPDTTLPVNSNVLAGCTACTINGGTPVGNNLFHSFSQFSVPTGGTAFFNNALTVQNILTRVTGLLPSNIDGILRANGTANLFLMNPNGIIFGPNARLNIGGSFVATTANAIQFGDKGFFSASVPNVPSPLLTINPSAFLFNQIHPAPIQSNSNALGIREGQSLLLLGGEVTLDKSFLFVDFDQGGRVELGGLAAPGKVDLSTEGSLFRLSFPDQVARADIKLLNNSTIDVTAGNGGSIAIHAQDLTVQNSHLLAGIAGGTGTVTSQAGDIDIQATGAMTLTQNSEVSNTVDSGKTGNAGNINITAGSLYIAEDARLNAGTSGTGNAGNIVMQVAGTAVFSGKDTIVSSNVGSSAIGNAGNISLSANSVSVTGGAQINSFTRGQGNAGNITIQATDSMTFDGIGSNGFPSSANTLVFAGAVGNGGNINLTAGSLFLTNGGQLEASVRGASIINNLPGGRGNGGTVNINVQDAVTMTGTDSGIFNSLGIGTGGRGGDINLIAGSLYIGDDTQMIAGTSGTGNAGNIFIQVAGDASFSGANTVVSSNVQRNGIGNAGNVTLSANSVSITGGAQINSFTRGRGNAGNVLVNARDRVEISGTSADGRFRSGIFVNSLNSLNSLSAAGNIVITTPQLLLD